MGLVSLPQPPAPPLGDYIPETARLRRFVMYKLFGARGGLMVAVELILPELHADVHVPMSMLVLSTGLNIKQELKRANTDVYTRMERVLNIMNNMDLALQAVEQEKDGIKKLFDRLWEEEKHP